MFTIQFGDYTFPNQTFTIQALPLSNSIKESNIPRRHGSVMSTPFLKSRSIRIKGIIHSANEDTTLNQLLDMQAALLAGEKILKIRSDRGISCRMSDIDTKYQEGADKNIIMCDIKLKAPVPFFCSIDSYVIGVTLAGGTQTFDVFAGGNAFEEPNFLFTPIGVTIADNLRLTNLTNGNEYFRFRGSVYPGITLRVSTEEYTIQLGGVDGISTFEGNFISLVAGTNSFQYVGGVAMLTIEHAYRWTN